jgi:hypothetical protein
MHNVLFPFLAGDEHSPPLRWADLPHDDLRRSMVYWAGWNRLVEAQHRRDLAGYDAPRSLANLSNNHIVRLEDPHMLQRLTTLLGLQESAIAKAVGAEMRNVADGQSPRDAKEQSGQLTWQEVYDASPGLAQHIWRLAKRRVRCVRLHVFACMGVPITAGVSESPHVMHHPAGCDKKGDGSGDHRSCLFAWAWMRRPFA